MERALKTGINKKVEGKLEKIARDTSNDIFCIMDRDSRPSTIFLHGAEQNYLSSLVIKLGLKFKEYEERTEEEVNIDIFTYQGEGYSIDVGALLNFNYQ